MEIIRTFMYSGYNRLGPCPLLHYHLGLSDAELQALDPGLSEALESFEWLKSVIDPISNPAIEPLTCGQDGMGQWFAGLALAILRRAGHRVSRFGIDDCIVQGQTRPWFEYDHPDSGHAAAELALELTEYLLGRRLDRQGSVEEAWQRGLNDQLDTFVREHAPLATPCDTLAIIDAARDRGIPRLRLDRPPSDPIEGDFRLRPHSLLRLGQGSRQHTVDGTFCVSRSERVFGLVRNRETRLQALASMHVPTAASHPDAAWCLGESRVVRAWRRIGRSVAVRPVGSLSGLASTLDVDTEDKVRSAARAALSYGEQVLVEPFIPGRQWLLLVGGGQCRSVLGERTEAGGGFNVFDLERVHPSITTMAEQIAARLDVGLMAVQIVTDDIDCPLAESGGVVVDVDLAPRLDRYLDAGDPQLHELAIAFVDWLFPDSARSRVPVVAVTGTNGKTTTARMIHRILLHSNRQSAMACSDGSFIGNAEISDTEDGHLIGHLRVLDHPETGVAVLESTRGSAGSTGLGFEHCRVGVCLNVSEDHLDDDLAIASIEEMARIKCSILEASDDAVVLNADDRHCLGMLAKLDGRRIGLVSQQQTAGNLAELMTPVGALAVVESLEGRDWLVVHDDGCKIPVVAIDEVPVCHGGRAVHNVSNTLHAILSAYLIGVAPSVIAAGLRELDTSFETHFGRLNQVDGLPFELIIDYAHNPDGLAKLAEFVRRTSVKGRRILNFSCSAANSDAFIRRMGEEAAGAFDHYVCKGFTYLYQRQPGEVARHLRAGLLSAGVSDESITVSEEEMWSIEETLAMARPGDLVVIVAGKKNKRRIYQMIRERATGQANN